MIKTNKLSLKLGLSTIIALPLMIVSCDSDEKITITNLELSPKTNIGIILESEVAHLSEVYQNVNDQSLALIKKLFDIQGTTTDQNLMNGLQIKMVSNGLNKTILLSVNIWLNNSNGFKINGNLTRINSNNFTVDTPPVLGDILTEELVRSFFAVDGKWAGKTALVATDFEGFTSIADSALSDQSLVNVVFPDSITKIGQGALTNNALTSLNIPNSVIEIGDGAFANNQLTIDSPITLPAQFDTHEERRRIGLPFEQPAINLELSPKTNIEAIAENEVAHLSEINQNVDDRSLALIKKLFDIQGIETTEQNLMDGLRIRIVSNGLDKTVWLTTNDCFKINGNLTEIDSMSFVIDTPPVLGDILTAEIANSFFAVDGKWAGKTTLVATDFEGFTSIADSALSGKSLVNVIFSDSITKIGQGALANNALTTLNIPNSVIEIGDGAFANNQLTIDSPITLPAQFDNPLERERIGLPFEQPAINLELSPKTNIEAIAENEVAHLSEINQNVDDRSLALIKKLFDIQGIETTEQNLMDGLRIRIVSNGLDKTVWLTTNDCFKINGNLTEIDSMSFVIDTPPVLGDILTAEIANSFFAVDGKWEGKTALVATDFEGFTSIGENAFQGLSHLSSVDLHDKIIRIEDRAFYQTKLRHITLGKGVEHIGFEAFSRCSINKIILPSSLKTMGEEAFSENNITNIIIPSSLKIIPIGAFLLNQLTSVIIPDTITEIGEYAFLINNLTQINIPDSVVSIGDSAFAVNSLSGELDLHDLINLESIESNAFRFNNISSIIWPTNSKINSIGLEAFGLNNFGTSIPNFPPGLTTETNGGISPEQIFTNRGRKFFLS